MGNGMSLVASLARRVSPSRPRPATALRRDLRWVVGSRCPRGWRALCERSGGGPFHSPPGLAASAPAGMRLFAELYDGEQVVGAAAGVASRCRFGFTARHIYFPTPPALVEPAQRRDALHALLEALRAAGAADVRLDSFDAAWQPDAAVGGAAHVRERLEYVVSLGPSREGMANRCSKHHRRHMQRGERDGWELRPLEGDEARSLLRAVQAEASARAAGRGDPFAAALPDVVLSPLGGRSPWGVTTFSAWDRGTPLAAALVAWANRRAFYLIGGSTPAGYERDAAQWLHWRIMCTLADAGFRHYNLGGTPASAGQPEDAAHGLYRFKTGFGPEVVSCRNLDWILRPAHARAHRAVHWVTALIPH